MSGFQNMLDSANMESFLLQIPEDSGRRYKKKWCRYLADVARKRKKKSGRENPSDIRKKKKKVPWNLEQ